MTNTAGSTLYELHVDAYPAGALSVISFDGHEEMNGLYSWEVVVWGTDIDEVELEERVLGRPVALSMHLAAGASRHVRGIVSRLDLEGHREAGRKPFRLTIVPKAWRLGKRVNSRIFQDKTVRQITDIILDEHGITRDWSLLARYPVRQFCVQHQEDDLRFITRILADEGIFFSFEQPALDAGKGEAERLVFGDNAPSYRAISGDAALRYRPQQGDGAMHVEEDQILDFRERAEVGSDSVVLRDYDFRRTLPDLTSSATAPGAEDGPPLQVYDHDRERERTATDDAGVYLEQLRAGLRVGHGVSACRRLLPGHRFDLHGHDVEKLNAPW